MYIFPKPLDQNNHCFKKLLHYDHKKLTVEVCFSYQISLAFYIEVNGQEALFPGASLAIVHANPTADSGEYRQLQFSATCGLVLLLYTRQTTAKLTERGAGGRPFILYVALTCGHGL